LLTSFSRVPLIFFFFFLFSPSPPSARLLLLPFPDSVPVGRRYDFFPAEENGRSLPLPSGNAWSQGRKGRTAPFPRQPLFFFLFSPEKGGRLRNIALFRSSFSIHRRRRVREGNGYFFLSTVPNLFSRVRGEISLHPCLPFPRGPFEREQVFPPFQSEFFFFFFSMWEEAPLSPPSLRE